jgi:hypothetical protein
VGRIKLINRKRKNYTGTGISFHNQKAGSRFGKFWRHAGWLLPAGLAAGAQRILAVYPEWTERNYTTGIFRIISWPLLKISSLFPFSLTELAVVIVLPLLIVFLLSRAIIRLIRIPEHRFFRILSGFSALAWILSIALTVFMLFHGFNYARQPVAVSFELPVRERSTAELTETAVWLAKEAAGIRSGLNEDENGVFKLGKTLSQTQLDANQAFSSAAADWPALAGYKTRPKGVMLSRYWSYTGITGVYNPWFVEANVNIDQPNIAIPDTTAHELAHTRGFAREDEAGFIAFLTGQYAENPDYRYSVLASAWIRLSNRLYAIDREGYEQAAAPVSEAMRRDFSASAAYWKQFEGPVRVVSNQANNLYLQANMQEDGVRSYGRMIDLVLAWYEYTAP